MGGAKGASPGSTASAPPPRRRRVPCRNRPRGTTAAKSAASTKSAGANTDPPAPREMQGRHLLEVQDHSGGAPSTRCGSVPDGSNERIFPNSGTSAGQTFPSSRAGPPHSDGCRRLHEPAFKAMPSSRKAPTGRAGPRSARRTHAELRRVGRPHSSAGCACREAALWLRRGRQVDHPREIGAHVGDRQRAQSVVAAELQITICG